MRNFTYLIILLLATACSPKVRTDLVESNSVISKNPITQVSIIKIDESVPPNAKKLGSVNVYDGGLTLKCDYQTVLEKAQVEAINAGGNILKITKHITPGLMSSCHQIKADIYFVENLNYETETNIAKTDVIPLPDYDAELAKVPIEEPYQKYRIAFNGGFSYLIAKTSSSIPAEFKDYVNELKSGHHFSIDAGYFWKENIGLGLKYSTFRSSNSLSNIYVTDQNGQTRYGTMSDDINTQFIGPILYNRGYNKTRKTAWFADAFLGYINYKNNSVLVDKFIFSGGALGGGINLGADFTLAKNLNFGLGVGYTAGVLKNITVDNGFSKTTTKLDEDNYESMNRIDLSAGLRWAW